MHNLPPEFDYPRDLHGANLELPQNRACAQRIHHSPHQRPPMGFARSQQQRSQQQLAHTEPTIVHTSVRPWDLLGVAHGAALDPVSINNQAALGLHSSGPCLVHRVILKPATR